MDSKILLGKILQRFFDKKEINVEGYTSFGYIKETENAVYVTRVNGLDTRITFAQILKGIEAYKANTLLYQQGPISLMVYGITHVTSPVWSMLHLLDEHDYK